MYIYIYLYIYIYIYIYITQCEIGKELYVFGVNPRISFVFTRKSDFGVSGGVNIANASFWSSYVFLNSLSFDKKNGMLVFNVFLNFPFPCAPSRSNHYVDKVVRDYEISNGISEIQLVLPPKSRRVRF